MPAGFLEYLDHFDKRPFSHTFTATSAKLFKTLVFQCNKNNWARGRKSFMVFDMECLFRSTDRTHGQ